MNFTRNQGQSCGSTSRLFVHRDIAEAVKEATLERARKITLGLPELDDTEMGSLVSRQHQERVLKLHRHRQERRRALVSGWFRPRRVISQTGLTYCQPFF